MKFAKKVFIAIDLSLKQEELLKPLKSMDFLNHCEVHFVHVFPTITYGVGFGEYGLIYPIEADRKVIEQSALATLVKISQEVLPPNFEGKVLQKVLFHENPRRMFSDYARDVHADTIIITTKRKHGFFESSFADYVNKRTECNMIYLKHKDEEKK